MGPDGLYDFRILGCKEESGQGERMTVRGKGDDDG